MKQYFLYIATNFNNHVIYTGVTNDIERRMWQHKTKITVGFTAKYNINKLVYLETFSQIDDAIRAEKRIKGWTRDKKIKLIESKNPEWKDLSKTK